MKKLMLSGALLLSVAASCGVARAQTGWWGTNERSERSYHPDYVTPNPASGSATDATWSVTNRAPANNNLNIKGYVKNTAGDTLPEWGAGQLQTGASLLKDFVWTGGAYHPNFATKRHRIFAYGNLAVTYAGPPVGTKPALAKVKVLVSAFPGNLPGPERGDYTLEARHNWATGTTDYVDIIGDGGPNPISTVTGRPNRYFNADSTAEETINSPRDGQTLSVEVRIKGLTKAYGLGTPAGRTLSASLDASIGTTEFTLR